MFDYIKMLIISLVSGLFAPLPVSYGAQYSFLNNVLGFSADKTTITLYFSILSIVFSVVAIFNLRKIYSKGIKSIFSRKNGRNEKNYRRYMLNILISLIPAAVMFIPYAKGKLVMDLFSSFLTADYLWGIAWCCIGSGLLMFISMWYTRQNYADTHRSSKALNIVRFGIYQIPPFIFPGLSNVAVGASVMLISDTRQETVAREILMFLSPSILVVNTARLIRTILSGAILNPILIIIAVLGSAVGSAVMILIIKRINLRKTFLFFSLYSILFGVLAAVYSFAA